jgi:DNA-binding response OmpR family regulator
MRQGLLLVSRDDKLKGQIKDALRAAGVRPFCVEVARQGQECLARLKGRRGCFVVVDDDLSDMRGTDLLHAIRAGDKEALIVYVAARHDLELERQVRQLRVLYYTAKPPEQSELVRLFNAALLRRENPWTINCPPSPGPAEKEAIAGTVKAEKDPHQEKNEGCSYDARGPLLGKSFLTTFPRT